VKLFSAERRRETAKPLQYFKHEVVQCAEEKGNHEAAAVFGVYENNVQLQWKLKAVINKCEVLRKKFTGRKIGYFLKLMMQPSRFFRERFKTRINCVIFFLQHIHWHYHFFKIQL
jgi:hypothetical protein